MSLGGQHPVGDAGVARRLRHPVELGALGVLHDHEAAGLVHVADAARAVAAAAREHDRDGARPQSCASERKKTSIGSVSSCWRSRSLRSSRPPEMIISFLGGIR